MTEIPRYSPSTDRATTEARLKETLAKSGSITIFDMHENLANIFATREAEGIISFSEPFMHTPDYAVATWYFPKSNRGVGSSQLVVRDESKKEEVAIEFIPCGRFGVSSIFYWVGNPEKRFATRLNWRDRRKNLQIAHDVFVANAPMVTQEPQHVQAQQVSAALSA